MSRYSVAVLGLGLGAMGLPIATRLATELDVHGYDIALARRELADQRGVRTHVSAVAAVEAVGRLDRAQVRSVFEERFSATTMAGNYVDIYQRLLARSRMPGALRVVQGS